jgi:NAD(P)-dependent dehydrogenase (short-subunit alcohol dehydrogenase family)
MQLLGRNLAADGRLRVTGPSAQRVIVVGGAGTLGRVLCAELAGRGARVGLTFLTNEQVARELCEAHAAHATRLDVRRTEDIAPALDRLADKLGGVDAVIYAAAIASTQQPAAFDRLAEVAADGWDELFAVNVRGAFFVAQHAATLLGANGGNLVLIGSIDGVKPMPAPVPYAASKGALGAMATSLAKELGKRNIRVNVVAPGVLEAGASRTLPDDLRAEYLRHCSQKRYGTLAETARAIAFIALRNTYLTGQTLLLDGGL